MLFVSSEDDPQVLEVLTLFQRSCPEKVLRSDSLVLQTSPGSYVREKDGSLPTRLTAIAHGLKKTFGGKTAETLAREYIAQLGRPDVTPIRTIDLVGCEIGVVKYDEDKNPILETKNTASENYCFAQDFSERLKAAGYDIRINVFSNRGYTGPIHSIEFTKISDSDQFCLVGYETKADVMKGEERDAIFTKIEELTQQLKFITMAYTSLTTVVCNNPDDHKAIQNELDKLGEHFAVFPSSVEAFNTLIELQKEIKKEIKVLDGQQKKLGKEINYIMLGEIDSDVRRTLDSNLHCHFPMRRAAAATAQLSTVAKIKKALPTSPVAASPLAPADSKRPVKEVVAASVSRSSSPREEKNSALSERKSSRQVTDTPATASASRDQPPKPKR